MGGHFSRAGTDTYYNNYEKAFERLDKESSKLVDRRVKRRKTMDACSNVGFWTQALGFCIAVLITAYLQQVNSQKWYEKGVMILGSFAVPVTSAVLFKGLLWMLRFAEARDERFLKKLMDAKRKMVKDLKDSTRFEKTAALIKKYDPDEQAPVAIQRVAAPVNGGLRHRNGVTTNTDGGYTAVGALAPRLGTSTPGAALIGPAAAAASAAVTVAAGTGKALMPVFESLANNLLGDNPVLIQEAHQLRLENDALKAKIAELEARVAETNSETQPEEELLFLPSAD